MIEASAYISGKSCRELYSSLYTPVRSVIFKNSPDAQYWLTVPHSDIYPTPEEILTYVYDAYRNKIEDPLFYPQYYREDITFRHTRRA